jgi:hypothetical protein
MDSQKKSYKYVLEKRIFPLNKTEHYELWGVEGLSGVWTVTVDKQKMVYKCNCKNIRNTECAHIKGVRSIKNG